MVLLKKNLTGQYLQVSIEQKRSHRAISQYSICFNYICITYTQFHRAISTSTAERTTVKNSSMAIDTSLVLH